MFSRGEHLLPCSTQDNFLGSKPLGVQALGRGSLKRLSNTRQGARQAGADLPPKVEVPQPASPERCRGCGRGSMLQDLVVIMGLWLLNRVVES